jgi:DNA-binding transcriptional ArsR family regulator
MAEIEGKAARLALAKLTLAHIRLLSSAYLGKDTAYTADLTMFMIALGIFVGMCEESEMTPHKLSRFLGIPRETVRRKLKEMEALGLVEMAKRVPCIPTTKVNSTEVLAAVRKRLRLLDETYRELLKLGTFPLDPLSAIHQNKARNNTRSG